MKVAVRRTAGFLVMLLVFMGVVPTVSAQEQEESSLFTIFLDGMVHFSPDSSGRYLQTGQRVEDNGRILLTDKAVPALSQPVQILAHLTLKPIPKDARSVHDRWDRAGNIRLRREGEPDLEIVRFMTSYGGTTDHTVDVSWLAPLLTDTCTFAAFVDTWVSPAWRIDFCLEFISRDEWIEADWTAPIYFTDTFTAAEQGDGVDVDVTIPDNLERVVMMYYSTGHCTDGIDADEFISKPNVISVDGVVVERYHPWRDDCRRFRARNPYCARWSDGYWSSDYSRSGWCPGVEVLPVEIDLTDHLTAGNHTVRFMIENMRPENEEGHYGYWRVSAFLVGWEEYPEIWLNWDE